MGRLTWKRKKKEIKGKKNEGEMTWEIRKWEYCFYSWALFPITKNNGHLETRDSIKC